MNGKIICLGLGEGDQVREYDSPGEKGGANVVLLRKNASRQERNEKSRLRNRKRTTKSTHVSLNQRQFLYG